MKFSFLLASALLAAVATPTVQAVRGGIVGGGHSLEAFDGLDLSLSMSMPAASSKAAKMNPCAHRLELARESLLVIGEDMDEEDINEVCHYQPEGIHHPEFPSGPNFGCTFAFHPQFGWSQGSKEFWGQFVDSEWAQMYVALEMYCECHAGIEDGCATKIPREEGDKKWVDYCKGAGVWNGDFLLEDTSLTKEVETCGCHFIGATREKIDDCPGVNLGEFFCDAEDNGVSVCPDRR